MVENDETVIPKLRKHFEDEYIYIWNMYIYIYIYIIELQYINYTKDYNSVFNLHITRINALAYARQV